MSISTDKPTEHLTRAKYVLSELHGHIDREPLIQAALEEFMQSGDNVVERFHELADEQPEVPKRVLIASVSELVNLHVVHSVSAELKRTATS